MKFTKFIPAALVVALAVTPGFAANTDTVESEFTLTNPEYFNVTEIAGAVKSATGTVTENPETGVLSLSVPQMSVSYRVVNNMKDKTFYIKAQADGSSTCVAFGGTANAPIIALANTAAGEVPSDAAIGNAIGGTPAVASNANVIALAITPGAVTPTQGTIAPPTMNGNSELVYVAQPGTFTIPFTFATAPVANTFSSHDASGDYKATIIVTDVATP